jgi:hypothetical protein
MSLDSMILTGMILSGITYGTSSIAVEYMVLIVDMLFVGVVLAICMLVLRMSCSGSCVSGLSWRPVMTCWLLLLATVSTALQIKWTLLAFVTQRQDVSPSVFIEQNVNNRIYVMLYVL